MVFSQGEMRAGSQLDHVRNRTDGQTGLDYRGPEPSCDMVTSVNLLEISQ